EAKSALRAVEMPRRHRQREGGGTRAVPDFLTGAHALMQCNGLITRDVRLYRDYVKGLKLVVHGAGTEFRAVGATSAGPGERPEGAASAASFGAGPGTRDAGLGTA